MSRDELIEQVQLRGVNGAESLCSSLTDEQISHSLTSYDAEGKNAAGLLAWRLMNPAAAPTGRVESFALGAKKSTPKKAVFVWNEENRMAWIEENLPSEMELDYGMAAEVAIIGICKESKAQGVNPTEAITIPRVQEWLTRVRASDPNVQS